MNFVLVYISLSGQIQKESYYKSTLETLHGYQDGLQMLGKPIQDKAPRFVRSSTAYNPSKDTTWTDGYIAVVCKSEKRIAVYTHKSEVNIFAFMYTIIS